MKPITRANFAIGAEKEKQYGLEKIIAFIVVIAWKFVLIMQWKRLKKQQNT